MNKERLVLEYMAMRDRWGEKPKLCQNDSELVWWEYDLLLEGNNFPIKIIYPKSYPSRAPKIISVSSLPNSTPHIFLDDHRLCWRLPSASTSNNQWQPSRDTAAVCIGVAYQWFAAFLVWNTIGVWPIEEAT